MEEKMFTKSESARSSSGNNNLKINISKPSDASKSIHQSQKTMDFAHREPHKTLSPKPTTEPARHLASQHTQSTQMPTQSATKAQQPTPKPTQSDPKLTKSATKVKSKFKTKSKQNLIFLACGIFAVLAVALISWGIITLINKGAISEDTTFATNDTQATITIEPTDSDNNSISHTRTVYEFDGDNVVGMKTYFEYADNEAAKTAYELIKDQPEFKGAEVVDKYIIVTADPNSFRGLTADDIRQQAEAIEQFQNSRKKTETKNEEAPQEDVPQEESSNPEENHE